MKELKISDLNDLYNDAESVDKEVFAEQRSNVLLIAGEHYNRRNKADYNSRSRDPKQSTDSQRLRLTKNHIHKVYRHYVGNILSYAPGVMISPQVDSELQDQKDAELNQSVWDYFKEKYRLKEKVRQWAQDYCGIGEVALKIFFDPNQGELMGYEAMVEKDPEGNVLVDEMDQPTYQRDEQGQVMTDKMRPIFKGAFVFERLFGFNLLRAPGCTSMEQSPYLIVRKMVEMSELKKTFAGDDEKLKMIKEDDNETYVIFDSSKSEYSKTKNQVLVKEYYWKPCMEYPEGYYAIATSNGILSQGELPYGIYPIKWQGFDEYPTTPRGRAIIKQARPFQAEINRASSAVATHQVTVGDDKVIYQAGTKLAAGTLLPGVRGVTYSGLPPTILPGRDGSQFTQYIEKQIAELYDVVEMQEENQDRGVQADPYSMLFASMKQLKKYAIYGEKFEQFLIDVCQVSLELAKKYLPDEELLYAIGKDEQANISEFRKTTKLCYQIKVEPRNETIETQLGKQLSFNHILQYVGTNLDKSEIGKLIRNMPFGNNDESFKDFTLDYDNVKNDMLMLERGQMPPISKYDDHKYIVKKVTSRMREGDFRYLSAQIQQMYEQYVMNHEKIVADQERQLLAAKDQIIPTGGAMIAADMYIPDPKDPTKAAKRVRIPFQAMDWLVQRLDDQGQSLQKLETMNQGAQADLASLVMQMQNKPQGTQSPPMGRQNPAGPVSSIGVS